jgi:hypothetical protein
MFLAALACSPLTAVADEKATAEINQLVETFKSSIVTKDGPRLESLFLPEHSSWYWAYDQATFDAQRAKKPMATRYVYEANSYKTFTQFVGSTTHAVEEKFSNVHIQADGAVGSVYFDYVFLLDGKATNHGNETWQLIRTDNGWKISAMHYSVILDPTS